MKESIAQVGLDVHKASISVGLAERNGSPVSYGEIENRPEAVRRLVGRLARRYERLSFAYEAGPCGYEVYRQLKALGHSCLVVAPSLIPRRPGDRIKTDRRDAMMLARLLRSGDLTAVWVPEPRHEAVRELVRCRVDFKQMERRCRQRVCALLLRHGRHWDRSTWTQVHRRWLRSQRFELAELQAAFEQSLQAIEEAEARVSQVEREMEEALAAWSLAPLVRGLMAMRGVKLITAMTLAAELGDLSRFRSPGELMAYVGLVPGERSSGSTRRQGGITKSGNRHVRRVLVESAWSYRHAPYVSQSLLARGRDASEAVRGIARQAQKRLHARYRRLTMRGKPAQVTITAVAREELGFIWSIGHQVMREQRALASAGA
jgi:transposase